VIDAEGYRANVGIIICNDKKQLLWCQRIGSKKGWQFPQGGIHKNETEKNALYRELEEELGLLPDHVNVLACSQGWLKYKLPKRYQRPHKKPLCIGQKQKWFLLQLIADESLIKLDQSNKPEFSDWHWVNYWHPVSEVIRFKHDVYLQALTELEAFLP